MAMHNWRWKWCWVLLCGLAVESQAWSQAALSPEQVRFFETKIRPVLVRECFSCHSSEVGQVRGGLWLDTAEGVRTGGDSGPAVVPGDLEQSLLWNAINHVDFQMPPRRRLSADILADFRRWIEMGAPDPRQSSAVTVKSGIDAADIAAGREFWSFRPPQRPAIPAEDDGWSKHDIDRLVSARRAEHSLQPAPDASAAVLLRRVSFDLLGLPPSPEQLETFDAAWHQDPDVALQRTVDAMLEQTQFGERWGRHWLDLVRYAESSGREVNLTYPYAWRYRDYVIDAFNADKPYHRFLQEQIAGDLLPVANDKEWAQNLIATGFMALGPKALNEQNGRQFELDVIDEQIDVTTRVMLGLSIACARCHDHKFDPIPQTDYYALAGIFRGMSTHYGTFRSQQNRRPSNLIVLPVEDRQPMREPLTAEQLSQLRAELQDKQQELRDAFQARRQRATSDSSKNGLANVIQIGQLSSTVGIIQATLDSYDSAGRPLSLCMAVQETTPTNARLLERGEFNKPAQEVRRGFPQVLSASTEDIARDSTGRLELARWIGSADNPLTARVMVNRIWQHLLGQAIVRTPEDFGSTGQPPTHPELLDYLAVEFMEHNWSIKHLIRTIMLSRTYRMSSQFDERHFELDPENRYLWRVEPKRLEAEAIRDSLLAASGELDLQRPLGSLVAQAGTALVRDGSLFSISSGMQPTGKQTEGKDMRTQMRERLAQGLIGSRSLRPSIESLDQPLLTRSVYLPVVRDSIPRALDVFDFAESSMVIGVRETSNTPDQGLYFLNNTFVMDRAEAFARRVMSERSDVAQQIQYAFLLAYSRPASSSELRAARDFYRNFPAPPPAPSRPWGLRPFGNNRARPANSGPQISPDLHKMTALCQAIMASAEFRFVN